MTSVSSTSRCILERALGGKGIRIAQAIENLAILHAMAEDYPEAAKLIDRSRAMTEEALGPDHAHVGQAWLNVASAQRSAGKLAEAAEGFHKAIAIWAT